MKFTQITIDLEVYKALEVHRLSFDEEHNNILRRLLNLLPTELIDETSLSLETEERRSRRSGDYELVILSTSVHCSSLKEVLKEALLKVEARQPGFLDRLSHWVSPRSGRHIVARQRSGVHPESPQLAKYAERLTDGWWFDTNISRGTCMRYLETIGKVAGIEQPQLLSDGAMSNELED